MQLLLSANRTSPPQIQLNYPTQTHTSQTTIMSGYVNPIHGRVLPGQQSGYSSLGGAMPAGGQASLRRGFRLPQPAYVPKSKWHSATGRTNHPEIRFTMKGTAADPVPMRDLSARSVPGIFGMINAGEDRVLQASGLTRITFRILVRTFSNILLMFPGTYLFLFFSGLDMNPSSGPALSKSIPQTVLLPVLVWAKWWLKTSRASSRLTAVRILPTLPTISVRTVSASTTSTSFRFKMLARTPGRPMSSLTWDKWIHLFDGWPSS